MIIKKSVFFLLTVLLAGAMECEYIVSYDYYYRSDLFGEWWRCKMVDYDTTDTITHHDDIENSGGFLSIDQEFFREYLWRGNYTLMIKYEYWLDRNVLGRENSNGGIYGGTIAFRSDTLCILQPERGKEFYFLPYEGNVPPEEWPDSLVVEK